MASSHDNMLCGICNEQEVIKHAHKWCPECDEGLCIDCEKHHRISKSSRHHAVISIDDYKSLPAEIAKIYHHCEVHERKFQVYCPHHDQPCCPLCISKDHNTCTGLVAIEEVVKNVKSSSLLETIEQSLQDCRNNIETIINDKEQNLSKIKIQRQKILEQITQTRVQINTHLDNLERGIITELDAAEQKLTFQVTNFFEKMKEKCKSVKKLQNDLSAIKSHASDLQTFLGSKKLEKQADKEEKYIRNLAKEDSLQTINLKLAINEQIANITAISNFGSVTTDKEPSPIDLHMKKDKQAQIKFDVRKLSIDTIQLTSIRTFHLPTGKDSICLTGCSIFPNHRIAFADCDYNQRIVITNDLGVLQTEIFLSPSRPFDLTCFDDISVAFSQFSQDHLKIINTGSNIISKTIKTTACCDGVTNTGGTLIYCQRNKGIQRLDRSTPNTVVHQQLISMTYVVSNENNIYHTNNKSHIVTCYSMDGDKIWKFKDTSILNRPYGVAVDKHSNVYVASHGNGNIIVISPDGKTSRKLLYGIKNPWGLSFDKERGNLVVACYEGKVLLYRISYS